MHRRVAHGGDGSFSGAYAGDAEASESFLAAFDAGGERLIREEQSRTTFENARNTRELLAAHGLSNCALVTSAFHMPRSVGLFRALDIPVIPWPTDYRTSGKLGLGLDFTQPSLNAQLTTTAVREWIGLIGYYLARSNPGNVYGAAGSLAIALLWIYYSSIILLLGAEFTEVWACRNGDNVVPRDGAVRVRKQVVYAEGKEEGREVEVPA